MRWPSSIAFFKRPQNSSKKMKSEIDMFIQDLRYRLTRPDPEDQEEIFSTLSRLFSLELDETAVYAQALVTYGRHLTPAELRKAVRNARAVIQPMSPADFSLNSEL
jgi:hypothetical protein